MADSSIFVHFRPDERIFVEKCLDWVERSSRRSQVITTPFLDPREQYILDTIVNREVDLSIAFDGGYPSAERKRAVIAPDYFGSDFDEFELAFLRLEATDRQLLEHPDVLGSILGLGLKREKLGDIQPHQHGCDLVVAQEMVDFLRLHLQSVGRKKVLLHPLARDQFFYAEPHMQNRTIIPASMRVDAIISEAYRLSRTKTQELIKSGRCKINWKIVGQTAEMVDSGDVISVRGFGRIRVICVEQMTKKGRKIVQIASFS